jgi:hypothetical protein
VFAGLGFHVEIEPNGSKGPDIGVSRDGHHAVVEVTRFRNIFPGPPEFDMALGTIVWAEKHLKDTRKALTSCK